MAIGRYLAIGLNAVDPAAYGGWSGTLRACENDARDMSEISTQKGFTGKTLLTAAATSIAVLKALNSAANELVSGDLFVISYSGHGGQIDDVNADEVDQVDETWVLYDRMLVDDELYAMWAKFQPGVRILMFSDSCHSGTVAKFVKEKLAVCDKGSSLLEVYGGAPKVIDEDASLASYRSKQSLYDSVQYVAGDSEKGVIRASVLLISGCQDDQLSYDGPVNGKFTKALKLAYKDGAFAGNYKALRDAINDSLAGVQNPNYLPLGAANLAFEAQKPFTL